MRAAFNQYPKLIYKLILLNALGQLIYFALFSEIIFQGAFSDNPTAITEYYLVFDEYSMLILGGLSILAGLIVDNIKKVLVGMFVSMLAVLIGCVFFYFPYKLTLLLGLCLVLGASSVFLILTTLHIAIFFPKANDLKDNIFMLSTFIALVAGIFSAIPMGLGIHVLILPVGASLLILLLISQFKDLGYKIESTNALEEDKPPIFGLIFCLIISSLSMLAGHFYPLIGQETIDSIGVEGGFLWSLLPLLICLILSWYLFSNPSENSNHYRKIIWGLVLLNLFGLIQFYVKLSGSIELNIISDIFISFITLLFLYPVLISIITHLNFDKNAGLWLGLIMGIPTLLLYFIEKYFYSPDSMILPLAILILVFVTITWIRDNKTFLIQKLKLNEANQELETKSDENDDPFNHLIPD